MARAMSTRSLLCPGLGRSPTSRVVPGTAESALEQ